MFKNKLYSILSIIECVAVAAVLLVLIISITTRVKEAAAESSASKENTKTETKSDKEPDPESKSETDVPKSMDEPDTDHPEEPGTDHSDEPNTDHPEASSAAEEKPQNPQAVIQDFKDVVLIGDSRTAGLGSNGSVAYSLIPDSSICAVWGGQLTDSTAKQIALLAANKHRPYAFFWYGVNDVQVNLNRDDAAEFINNYDAVIRCYQTINPASKIVILSVLTTGKEEKDYYPEQNANIQKYNEAIRAYCASNGFIYCDLESLPLSESDFCSDHIHFNESWYRKVFLPYVFPDLGF